ncbi:ABC-2 type transport system permease protein [Ereboglobus sp. PH5-5]|uniref:ABC transporter permease n=1 Tax=Ereboglobus sp. PH5-5 TaxID=2940529 RepID=UPI002406B7F6|nr:ABC transporter permease [Ereboglobus sp. PH5-5]MDF9832938.1 ABC-2 type transport system permease protein [Ereboglobus sp. PH5-5]
MSIILTLLRKEYLIFKCDRAAFALTFLVPALMIYIFGMVFGINRADTGPRGIPLAVVNECDNPAALRLIDVLRAEKGFRIITTTTPDGGAARDLEAGDLKPLMRDNVFRFAIVIPSNLIETSTVGVNLKLLSNPRNEIETQTVNGLLQKCIFSNVPQLLGQSMQASMKSMLGGAGKDKLNRNIAGAISESFDVNETEVLRELEAGNFGFDRMTSRAEGAADDGKTKKGNPLGELIKIENEQVVGKDVKSPAAARNVGAWAVMFLLFSVSHLAITLFEEKRAGLLQRLMSSSVRPSHVLWSKFLFGVLLGLVQLMALFCAGRLLYGLDIVSHFGQLLLVSAAAAGACAGFGMLIASIARTSAAAGFLTTLLVMLMSCLGGAWVPVSFMPEVVQKISVFTIPYWVIEGFMQVFWEGGSLARLAPTVGVLCGITLAAMSVAWWRFKRGTIFEP